MPFRQFWNSFDVFFGKSKNSSRISQRGLGNSCVMFSKFEVVLRVSGLSAFLACPGHDRGSLFLMTNRVKSLMVCRQQGAARATSCVVCRGAPGAYDRWQGLLSVQGLKFARVSLLSETLLGAF